MILANGKRTCKDWLQRVREDLGISEEDYGTSMQKEIHSRDLAVFHEKTPKKEKKARKKAEKKRRYALAYWYLNDYLKPEYSKRVYEAFDDLEDIVDFAYNLAVEHIENFVKTPEKREVSWEEWKKRRTAELELERARKKDYPAGIDFDNAPGTPVIYINENADIPDLYWDAFEHYCDEHPVKNAKQAKKRRVKFIKMVNKQYMKTYGKYAKGKIKAGDRIDTATYMALCVDPDRMIDNLKRIQKENEKQAKLFREEMEKWFTEVKCDPVVAKRLLAHSRTVRKQLSTRVDEMMEDLRRNGLPMTDVYFHYSEM